MDSKSLEAQLGCRRLACYDPGDSADDTPPFTYLSTSGLKKNSKHFKNSENWFLFLLPKK